MIKNVFSLLLASLLLLTSYLVNASSNLLLLGDSLSASYGMKQNQGWVHLLNKQLTTSNASYKIINASISGETTAGGLSRLPAILSKQNVDFLLIALGGNDGLRGFPTDLIKNNLLQMISLAKEKNIPTYLMEIKIPPNYGPRYNKMFVEVFQQVSKETNVPLLPFFIEPIAIQPHLMQNDGIHPNITAQPLIAESMAKTLKTIIKD